MNRRLAFGGAFVSLGLMTFIACVGDDPTAGTTAGSDGGGGGTDAPQSGDTSPGGDSACVPNCGSSCVDLNGDGKNCGTCGHDCLGGKCGSGKCEAAALYSGTGADAAVSGVTGLAVDGTNVFWVSPFPIIGSPPATRTTIYECANQVPCVVPTVYFQTNDEIDSLQSFSPGTLILGDNSFGQVERVRTDGVDASTAGQCPTGNPCLFSSMLGASSIASNGPKLFVGSNGNGTNGSGLYSTNADAGGTSTLMNTAVSGSPAVNAVGVDAINSYVYAAFTNSTIRVYSTGDNFVADSITIPTQPKVGQILVAHAQVFWTRGDTGDVMTIPVCLDPFCNNHTVPTPTKFATTLDGGYAITSDATNLYWSAGSNIYTCPFSGCTGGTPTKLAAGPARVHTITNDAAAIYWGDDQGSVWKIAK